MATPLDVLILEDQEADAELMIEELRRSGYEPSVIRADNGPIYVGARTSIQDGAVLHRRPQEPTIVGDDCVIGHLAHLEGCVIEDVVMVGSGSTVLHDVVCRRVSLVAAG